MAEERESMQTALSLDSGREMEDDERGGIGTVRTIVVKVEDAGAGTIYSSLAMELWAFLSGRPGSRSRPVSLFPFAET